MKQGTSSLCMFLIVLPVIACQFFCQSDKKSKSDAYIEYVQDTLAKISEQARIEDSLRQRDTNNLIGRETPLKEEVDQLEGLRNKMVDLEKQLNKK